MSAILIWNRVSPEGMNTEIYHLTDITDDEKKALTNSNSSMVNSVTENPETRKVWDAVNPDAQGGPWAGKWVGSRAYVSVDLPLTDEFDLLVVSGIFEGFDE